VKKVLVGKLNAVIAFELKIFAFLIGMNVRTAMSAVSVDMASNEGSVVNNEMENL
jgi:hypothetical protein